MLRRELKRAMFGQNRRRRKQPEAAGIPIFATIILVACISSCFSHPTTTPEQKLSDFEQQLELWRAHPDLVAYPIRSK